MAAASAPAPGKGSPAQRESGPRVTRERLSWGAAGGTTEEPPMPSQAEGARETVEQDLCEKGLAPQEECEQQPAGEEPERLAEGRHLPSQAEGERDIIEEDLAERQEPPTPADEGTASAPQKPRRARARR